MVSHQVIGSSTEKGETQIVKLQEQNTNKNSCFSGIYNKRFYTAPKPLQMVIAAMKLKDSYSLEEKL